MLTFFVNKELIARSVINNVYVQEKDMVPPHWEKVKMLSWNSLSPNIAKPFSIAHIRTTVIGHALRNIYKFFGFNTIAINHLGDYGTSL